MKGKNVPKGVPKGVRILWEESDLGARVKEAGGRWDAERKLREVPADKVRDLNLEDRVVPAAPGV